MWSRVCGTLWFGHFSRPDSAVSRSCARQRRVLEFGHLLSANSCRRLHLARQRRISIPACEEAEGVVGVGGGRAATPQDHPESKTKALKARFIISMPQSLSRVIIHIIFSTKNRELSIDPDIRPRLHAYLATVARDNGSEVYRVGGVADHVHILATLSRTVTQAELIEEIKKHSSRWVKEIDPKHGGFAWQRGYGAYSVGRDELDDRVQYVETQEEHHRTVTFQEEYRSLLEKHGIEFDERYVWD